MKLSLWDLKPTMNTTISGLPAHHEVVPMGFETNCFLFCLASQFFIMKLSLWDLKRAFSSSALFATFIMKLSLWDLKLHITQYCNCIRWDHEVVPMGFET